MLQTSIAFIIFNRPHTTERVFAEIAKARPSKLFVIADGPRQDHPEDVELCAAARAIIDRINWKCEVFKKYSEVNLGCGVSPATGISWVFQHVEDAIILEDDDVPHPTFFRFCDELLERYRKDERVMVISGNNPLFNTNQKPKLLRYSYLFVSTPMCWGWATWRRAWQHFDFEISLWSQLRHTDWLLNKSTDHRHFQHWRDIFDRTYASSSTPKYMIYQWQFAIWVQNGLAIVPNTNLITNIGFGEGGTHTESITDIRAKLPVAEIVFPLLHPPNVTIDLDWDRDGHRIYFEKVLPSKRRELSFRGRLRRKFSVSVLDPIQRHIFRLVNGS